MKAIAIRQSNETKHGNFCLTIAVKQDKSTGGFGATTTSVRSYCMFINEALDDDKVVGLGTGERLDWAEHEDMEVDFPLNDFNVTVKEQEINGNLVNVSYLS